ncbi:translocase [Pseudomonas putida]|uniref:Bactoprenol-linked glucose translocase n=2 Tax=Pseudomonas putida TaxID=303 RepID=A0A1X0ZTB9_PSEPU|nr:GtrA family protein [Pseudomonas putida]ORL62918.1 translocase [Pseudomonas putida]
MKFFKYASIGVLNTGIHWGIFGAIVASGLSQSISNVIAFLCAVTFSFFANAKVTFQARASATRYVLYVSFMGLMAFAFGSASDHMSINPLVTLVAFSGFSLVAGYLYSNIIFSRTE